MKFAQSVFLFLSLLLLLPLNVSNMKRSDPSKDIPVCIRNSNITDLTSWVKDVKDLTSMNFTKEHKAVLNSHNISKDSIVGSLLKLWNLTKITPSDLFVPDYKVCHDSNYTNNPLQKVINFFLEFKALRLNDDLKPFLEVLNSLEKRLNDISILTNIKIPNLPEDSNALFEAQRAISAKVLKDDNPGLEVFDPGSFRRIDPNHVFAIIFTIYDVHELWHYFLKIMKDFFHTFKFDRTNAESNRLLNSLLDTISWFKLSLINDQRFFANTFASFKLCYYSYLLLLNQITSENCKNYKEALANFETACKGFLPECSDYDTKLVSVYNLKPSFIDPIFKYKQWTEIVCLFVSQLVGLYLCYSR